MRRVAKPRRTREKRCSGLRQTSPNEGTGRFKAAPSEKKGSAFYAHSPLCSLMALSGDPAGQTGCRNRLSGAIAKWASRTSPGLAIRSALRYSDKALLLETIRIQRSRRLRAPQFFRARDKTSRQNEDGSRNDAQNYQHHGRLPSAVVVRMWKMRLQGRQTSREDTLGRRDAINMRPRGRKIRNDLNANTGKNTRQPRTPPRRQRPSRHSSLIPRVYEATPGLR
jgi:hypothetical protein